MKKIVGYLLFREKKIGYIFCNFLFLTLTIILAVEFQNYLWWMPQIAPRGNCKKIYNFFYYGKSGGPDRLTVGNSTAQLGGKRSNLAMGCARGSAHVVSEHKPRHKLEGPLKGHKLLI